MVAFRHLRVVPVYAVAAALLLAFSCANAVAGTAQQLCNLPYGAINYKLKSLGWDNIPLYIVSTKGFDNLRVATKPLAVDFPNGTGSIQIFGFNPPIPLGVNDDQGQIGCLHYTDSQGHSKVAVYDAFDMEGGDSPEITDVFVENLDRGIGKTLVLITRIGVEAPHEASGYLYSVLFFSAKRVLEENKNNGWGELSKLEMKFSPDISVGFDGYTEGKWRRYPYRTRQQVIRRLRAIGYLK